VEFFVEQVTGHVIPDMRPILQNGVRRTVEDLRARLETGNETQKAHRRGMIDALEAVLILGAVKLAPKARYTVMAIAFIVSVGFYSGAYLSNNFVLTCVFAALASFANCMGNTVLNAALMLALPEENRGAILGFIQSASVGGTAVSTLAFGLLGDVFPLYLVFLVGNILSLLPMVYITLHSRIKELILSN
jgi:predicted MFS family arabinose efflux permease